MGYGLAFVFSLAIPVAGGRAFYWLLCLLASAPFVLLPIFYGRTLQAKRGTIENLMSNSAIFSAYIKRFRKQADPNQAVQSLFSLTYHWSLYALAIALNMSVIIAGGCAGIVRSGISMGLPPAFESLLGTVPPTLLLSFGGAYVYGLYDTLKRYRVGDLYPSSLHFSWLHMIVAAFLGPLLAQAFSPGVGRAVAFGIGVFPLKDSLETVKKYAVKRLQLSSSTPVGEGATLDKIQGMTSEMIERLEEEGVTSTVHLAYADPIKLLLRTNIPWVILIDVADQSLLFNYVGEKMADLRSMGIRGSIEMAAIRQRLYQSKNEEDKRCAKLTIHLVATRLKFSDDEALALIRTLGEDGQVDLLWELYTAETPGAVLSGASTRVKTVLESYIVDTRGAVFTGTSIEEIPGAAPASASSGDVRPSGEWGYDSPIPPPRPPKDL
jgi:hypothetical protein